MALFDLILRHLFCSPFQDGPYIFVPAFRAQPSAWLSHLDGSWSCWWFAVCVWKAFHHSSGLPAQTSQSCQIYDRLLDQFCQDWVIHLKDITHDSPSLVYLCTLVRQMYRFNALANQLAMFYYPMLATIILATIICYLSNNDCELMILYFTPSLSSAQRPQHWWIESTRSLAQADWWRPVCRNQSRHG